MIRPNEFYSNEEAMQDNAFMNKPTESHVALQQKSLDQWTSLKDALVERGLVVHVSDNNNPLCPDAIFPNNWFSVHRPSTDRGLLCLYPMKCVNRRGERRPSLIDHLSAHYTNVLDMSHHECDSPKLPEILCLEVSCGLSNLPDSKFCRHCGSKIAESVHRQSDGLYLEGTGSMVLDRTNQIAYMALSQRTDRSLAEDWASHTGYNLHYFHTAPVHLRKDGGKDTREDAAVYHTNVMMSVGTTYAIVCLEAVIDPDERIALRQKIEETKEVIEITRPQMDAFCGNVLELRTADESAVLVMSSQAHNAFTSRQKQRLLKHVTELVHTDVSFIERAAGGGVRCMIAELF